MQTTDNAIFSDFELFFLYYYFTRNYTNAYYQWFTRPPLFYFDKEVISPYNNSSYLTGGYKWPALKTSTAYLR